MTRNKDLCTFVIISSSILLIMKNVSDKIFRGNQDMILVAITFFRKSAVCEIMWKNKVK